MKKILLKSESDLTLVRYNYSDYRKPELYNKDYHFINNCIYVYLDDFKN